MSGADQPGEKPARAQPPLLLIVLGTVLGTLLLAFGAYWFFMRRTPTPVAASQKYAVSACEARRNERGFQLSDCYTKYAEATGSPKPCEALAVGGEARFSRGDCLKRVALTTGDVTLCEHMDAAGRGSCLKELAVALEDVKLCEKMAAGDERDGCYQDLARTLQDPEICRRVAQERQRASCLALSIPPGTDARVCGMLQTTSGRESCLFEVARSDPQVCFLLPPGRRGQCVSMSPLTREFDDPTTPCGGATDCLATVAKFDITVCEKIAVSEKSRRSGCVDSVIGQAGGRWLRASTCKRLQDPELRDVCFNRLGHAYDHESACQLVVNEAMRRECLEAAKRKLAERL